MPKRKGLRLSSRLSKKIESNESYASGHLIESWIHNLLGLDDLTAVPELSLPTRFLPRPSECELYYVNRDALFLPLMADVPSHDLFVLLGPVEESKKKLAGILCVIQVSLEGQISCESVLKRCTTCRQTPQDQIPRKLADQFVFLDTDFPKLSCVRIVRIATHPSARKLGYGSQAVQLLTRYYEGQFEPISEVESDNLEDTSHARVIEAVKQQVSLLEETIEPQKDLPPLLVHLRERRPEKLHYIGVSFGLTLKLLSFWKKHEFVPFFINRTPNSMTGEHTCLALKQLVNDDVGTSGFDLGSCFQVFRRRFLALLGRDDAFRTMKVKLAMSVLDPKINFMEVESGDSSSDGIFSIKGDLSTQDVKRLEAYTKNHIDFDRISDLVPKLAHLYFEERLPITLPYHQACILLSKGLQAQIGLETKQISSQVLEVITKFHEYLCEVFARDCT